MHDLQTTRIFLSWPGTKINTGEHYLEGARKEFV
jgi:hypothetical protein